MSVLLGTLLGLSLVVFPLSAFADPCGDVDVDSDVDLVDITTFQSALADPNGAGLSAAGTGNCTVIGSPRPCDILDVAVLKRHLNASPLGPGLSPTCSSSLAGCEVLNATECLMPYPSTHYLTPAATATGFKLALTDAGMPELNVNSLPTTAFNELDGFSPTSQILMHFPQGVDLALSGASRLAPAVLPGPPWVDSRTYDGSSLDPNSPSVLIDAGTGERILHFLEPDARAAGSPSRQALVMRPGKSLTPGSRYIVAMRNLTATGGGAVTAENPFQKLRDSVVTGDSSIEDRRAYFDASIFPVLTADGITRSELVLAFDFIVQSEDQLTRQMLAMRDDAYAYVATIEADPNALGFTVDPNSVVTNNCATPGTVVWRRIDGTFESPLYLTAAPGNGNVAQHSVDPNDIPVRNGLHDAVFSISIPCASLDPNSPTVRPMILGHGLFGTGESMMGIPEAAGSVTDWNYIAGATDWRGLSSPDLLWVAFSVIGMNVSNMHNFRTFPDRLRQGMLNTLVLARLMKLGIFNRHTDFQTPSLVGVFPGPSEPEYYYGISLGGIMGTFMAALTPDIEKFGVDVPAINFACLLQRSTQFGLAGGGLPLSFESLLVSIGLTDPMETILGQELLHELWVSAEPAGYATHITSDPLAGSIAKKMLVTPAWLDKQVSNTCTEAMARTLGIGSHESSLQQGLEQIPDLVGDQDSALIMWDTGSFDLFDPNHAADIPPLANQVPTNTCDPHGYRPRIPASTLQLTTFMQPGGQIENFCVGLCDAVDLVELPDGDPNSLCTP
ncbi:MAG: hypothetical protein GY725_09950 [bacterium]|nr:hypothetical protein [bacterium]